MGVPSPKPNLSPEYADTLFKCICIFCLEQLWLSSLCYSNSGGMDIYISILFPFLVSFWEELYWEYSQFSSSSLLPYDDCRDRNPCTFQREGANLGSFTNFSISNSKYFHFHANPS